MGPDVPNVELGRLSMSLDCLELPVSSPWRCLGQEPQSSKPLMPIQLPSPLSLGAVPESPPEWA